MPRPSKTQSKRVKAAERRPKTIELRKQGLTYAEIGKRLGVDKATVCLDLRKALDEWRKERVENTDDLVAQECERLDQMLAGVWDDAISGNVKAIDSVLKIMDRRAKLFGLDAPKRTDVTSNGETISHAELLEALTRRITGE